LVERHSVTRRADRWWQFDVKLRPDVQVGDPVVEPEAEDVPPDRAIIGDEVQMRADHLDPVERIRKAEPHHRARDLGEIGHLLLGDRLRKRWIREFLLGH
jgi:hypothetical protein